VFGENAVVNGRVMADWREERRAARLMENLSTNFHQCLLIMMGKWGDHGGATNIFNCKVIQRRMMKIPRRNEEREGHLRRREKEKEWGI